MAVMTKPKVFHYTVGVRWDRDKRGTLASEGKPSFDVASPPEFRGHPGIWTPEDLLVAAINACTMTTFLSFASRREISLVSYDCEASGTLEMAAGKFRFTRVVLSPRIVVAKAEDREKALESFRSAEENCLISNSLVTRVEGIPEIVVRG